MNTESRRSSSGLKQRVCNVLRAADLGRSKGDEMISVAVIGASGSMGRYSVEAIRNDPSLELVAALDKDDDIGGALRDHRPQVTVDFTVAGLGFDHGRLILESGSRPVIGTSGFDQDLFDRLSVVAKEKGLGGIVAPNFSVGAVLMMKMAELCARHLPSAEIVELHHPHKKDAPSGTAKRTAELMAGVSGSEPPIHSVRLPGYVASQRVLFGGVGETLTIAHDSVDRSCFMPGVTLACRMAPQLDSLVFGLEHLLFGDS